MTWTKNIILIYFYYLWNRREYDEALCGRSIKPIRQEIIRRAFCNQRIHTDSPNSFRRSLGISSKNSKSAMIQLRSQDFSCILQLSPELSDLACYCLRLEILIWQWGPNFVRRPLQVLLNPSLLQSSWKLESPQLIETKLNSFLPWVVVQGLNDNNKVPIIRQSGDSQPLVSCHGKGQPVIKRQTTEVAGEGGVK